MGSKATKTQVQSPRDMGYNAIYEKDGDYFRREAPKTAKKGQPGAPKQSLMKQGQSKKNKGQASQGEFTKINYQPGGVMAFPEMRAQRLPNYGQMRYRPMPAQSPFQGPMPRNTGVNMPMQPARDMYVQDDMAQLQPVRKGSGRMFTSIPARVASRGRASGGINQAGGGLMSSMFR